MNVFGIGGWELILILVIMLIVAGPKRMAQWAYVIGQWSAKLQYMWRDMMRSIQVELDEAGIKDVRLPENMPTRENMGKWVNDAIKPMTEPLQETIDDVNKEMKEIQRDSRVQIKPRAEATSGRERKSTWQPPVADDNADEPMIGPAPKPDAPVAKPDPDAAPGSDQTTASG